MVAGGRGGPHHPGQGCDQHECYPECRAIRSSVLLCRTTLVTLAPNRAQAVADCTVPTRIRGVHLTRAGPVMDPSGPRRGPAGRLSGTGSAAETSWCCSRAPRVPVDRDPCRRLRDVARARSPVPCRRSICPVGLVLERDLQFDAVGDRAAVVDLDVLFDDFGDSKVAQGVAGRFSAVTAASSQDTALVPISSVTRYTLISFLPVAQPLEPD